jgi:RhtB (resistance to homoserine/threonine) family protein
MEHLALIATVIVVHFFGVASPGPDFIMAVRNSLTYSRKTGIWTSIGIGIGILVHISYCVAGLAIVISQSIILFNAFKYLGAIYLIYIGIKSLRARSQKLEIKDKEKKPDISAFKAVKIGFLTNVLNPKATLYFLSLFTLVISPDTPAMILVILSAVMTLETILWFSLVSIFLTQAPIRKIFEKSQGIFNKTLGGLLVALGIKVALTEE